MPRLTAVMRVCIDATEANRVSMMDIVHRLVFLTIAAEHFPYAKVCDNRVSWRAISSTRVVGVHDRRHHLPVVLRLRSLCVAARQGRAPSGAVVVVAMI